MPIKQNLAGQIFGRWTALECTGDVNASGSYLWNCICECGKNGRVGVNSLMSGGSRSCGCLSVDTNRELMSGKPARGQKPPWYVTCKRIYGDYKSNAKKKGVIFDIPISEFLKLTSSNCYYCGIIPLQKHKPQLGKIYSYLYNGLDKIDCNKGYVIGNVVPCCIKCNRAKFQMPQDVFLDLVKRIYLNRVNSNE